MLPGLAHSLQGALGNTEFKNFYSCCVIPALSYSLFWITEVSVVCLERLRFTLSPLPWVTEARVMQSCNSSSLGRWSMQVLTGKRERGFFFFSTSGAEACLSLLFTAAETFSWDSTGAGIQIHR